VARNRKRAKERRARRPQPVASRRPTGPSGAPEPGERTEPTDRGDVEAAETQRAEDGTEAKRPEPNARTDAGHAEEEIVSGPTASHPDELAPDPLQHAAPNVELADAEAFGPSEPVDAEFQHEEELVEEELKEQAEEERERKPLAPGERPNLWLRLIGFLQGSWRELQRVQWPDRRQVAQATGVVLGFVIVAGAFLGLSDLVAQKLVNFILK
jgi:preprotein translocase subunit SecE